LAVKLSVLGLGYVGSIVAAGLAAAGNEVLGVDIDAQRIASFRKGTLQFYEPGLIELIHRAVQLGNLRFLHNEEVSEPLGEVCFITTGTPTTETGEADLSQVRSALSWFKERHDGRGIVVVKSSVPPGTGMELVETVLSDTQLSYVSNPEFLREGQAVEDWFHTDRIVIGSSDPQAAKTVRGLYSDIDAPVLETDITSAEMVKYASNAFLATKISFINEISTLCDLLGAPIDDVARGIALDPRIGPSFLMAGVGYGGSCFPKDVAALGQVALNNGHDFELLRAVITVNNRQRLLPFRVLGEQLAHISDASVAVLGLAFKPNTDDVRGGPSLELIRVLIDAGARVRAYDPRAMRAAEALLPPGVYFAPDLAECVEGAQALVLMTEWPEIVEADWEQLVTKTRPPHLFFDGRNAMDPIRMRDCSFKYSGVGRRCIIENLPLLAPTHSGSQTDIPGL